MAQEYSFEEIERYLEGDMDVAEKETFEKLLSGDQGLAKRVKEQREAHNMVELYTRDTIKSRVRYIHDKVKKQQSTHTGRFPIMGIAASLALLAIIGIMYTYVSVNYNSQNLAGDAFELYPNRFRTMGEAGQNAFNQGLTAYDRQDFAEAITQFAKLMPDNEKYLDAQFYLGVSYLGAKQYGKAEAPFQLVLGENSLYENSAKWYLSLVYLHLDREGDAKKVLQEIIDGNGPKSQSAKELLDNLNSKLRRLPFIR